MLSKRDEKTIVVLYGDHLPTMGLTEDEVKQLPEAELKKRMAAVRNRMYAAGAHYVVDSICELPALIESINARMENEMK